MFDRKKYKSFAKIQLKQRWGIPVFMTAVCFVLEALLQIPSYIAEIGSTKTAESFSNGFNFSVEQNSALPDLLSFIPLLVTSVLTVAQICVYLKMSRSPDKVHAEDFFEGFVHAGRAILTGLWTFLWTFLWTLLFIIPGIVKSFAYSQVFYIISEYPHISITKALTISKLITKGYKGDLFVMSLSFLGWVLLCIPTCGIGFLWLIPYMNMSFTNAYHGLLKQAIESGILKAEDLSA